MTTENYQNAFPAITFDTDGRIGTEREGLTKREYFAAMAMQGFISSYAGASVDPKSPYVAARAVEYSDALIKALNKPLTGEELPVEL